MAETLCFYVDDSGARDPDRKFDGHPNNPDWFALGGLIIREADIDAASATTQAFRSRWPEIAGHPLHSYEIRNRVKRYRWLVDASAERKQRFMRELGELITALPIVALACVVDRPGYNKRYREKYGPRRWLLCKTAFSIALERAAKYARYREARLRVFVERSDRRTEEQLEVYYELLRNEGLPFDKGNSAQYEPLSAEVMKNTLLEFRIKGKESDLMQIADLVLWPVAIGGYRPDHQSYALLKEKGKLLEALVTEKNGLLGTKYSCIPEGALEKQKPAFAGS
jgi:hypothetical protein